MYLWNHQCFASLSCFFVLLSCYCYTLTHWLNVVCPYGSSKPLCPLQACAVQCRWWVLVCGRWGSRASRQQTERIGHPLWDWLPDLCGLLGPSFCSKLNRNQRAVADVCVWLYVCFATGLTSCQMHRQRVLQRGDETGLLPVCSNSGEYQAVQCQPAAGQCWCVDQEGMEIYGTRQNGRPARCKSRHSKHLYYFDLVLCLSQQYLKTVTRRVMLSLFDLLVTAFTLPGVLIT